MNPESTLQKSTFVTALAWVFIVLTGFGTFMTAAQNIMLRLMFSDLRMEEMQRQNQSSEQMPAIAQFMINRFDLFFAAVFLISLAMLIASIGLLKRKNWARLTFITILSLGIVWNLGGLVIQQIFMSNVPVDMNAPEEFKTQWETMHTLGTNSSLSTMNEIFSIDPRFVVAVYAAIVSTLALAWNIYQFIRAQRTLLRIQIGFSEGTMELRITNLGSSGRYLYSPQIVFGRKIGALSAYDLWALKSEYKYPVSIAAGEVLRMFCSLPELHMGFKEMRKELKQDDYFRFRITDSRHRHFYSPRLEITRFLDVNEGK